MKDNVSNLPVSTNCRAEHLEEIIYYDIVDNQRQAFRFQRLSKQELLSSLFPKGQVAQWMGFAQDPKSALRYQERYLKQTPALMTLLQQYGYSVNAKKMSGYCAHLINQWFCGAGNDLLIQIGIHKHIRGLDYAKTK